MQNPSNRFHYAIDKFWLQLQRRDHWYLITPLTVIQQEGYSDIEHKVVNYADLMTNMHKAILPPTVPSLVDNVNPNHMMKNVVYKKHF
jgi:hypothetical protein